MKTEGSAREVTVLELAELYRELAGEWLLLEILGRDGSGTPARFRLHAHDPLRDRLHDWLSEQEAWDWSQRYLLVHADPGRPCELERDWLKAASPAAGGSDSD